MQKQRGYVSLADTSDVEPSVQQPEYKQSQRNRLVYMLCLALCATVIILLVKEKFWSTSKQSEIALNPYGQPGYLRFDESDPLASAWIPYNPSVPRAVDYISHIRIAANLPLPIINVSYGINMEDRTNRHPVGRHSDIFPNSHMDAASQLKSREESLDLLRPLQNSTILLLGDSLDRNTVWFLAQNMASEASLFHPQYGNASDYDFESHPDWDISGIPHLLKLEGAVNMAVTNCFLYGHDESEFFKYQKECHSPFNSEDRISQLCKPYTEQLEHPVSLIQYQSGMWDLALFGRQDALTDERRIEQPLTPERLDWWRNRTISNIRHIKEAWPGVPIVYRTIHRPATNISYRDFVWDTEKGKGKNLFSDVRAAQLRQLQISVAREENLQIFDFATIFEGYQQYARQVHPLAYPGGVIMGNALLHYAWLSKQ